MNLGLFLDLRNPPPWERPWVDHIARAMQLVVDSERAGIDAVWLSEHHQFSDGYLTQPLAFSFRCHFGLWRPYHVRQQL